jgi:hypothetical protein
MTIGSGPLEGAGRPSTIRKRLVLESDWLDHRTILEESGSAPRLAATFFLQNCVDESVPSLDLGHVCVRGWLNWPKIKGLQKKELSLAPHTMHASYRHDNWHACMPTRAVPSRSESSCHITAISVVLVQRPQAALSISTPSMSVNKVKWLTKAIKTGLR